LGHFLNLLINFRNHKKSKQNKAAMFGGGGSGDSHELQQQQQQINDLTTKLEVAFQGWCDEAAKNGRLQAQVAQLEL
jgi:hypothetical protein